MMECVEDLPKNLDKALDELRSSEKELVRLTVDLIRFRSENPPLEDYDVQLYIRDFLGEAGLKSELHDPGDKAWALTSSFGKGDGGFIFYGHADVVPAGDPSRWSHPPFSGEIVGDRIYGRGAADMKGGSQPNSTRTGYYTSAKSSCGGEPSSSRCSTKKTGTGHP